ncbi:MAG: NADH-quinone oxidoreductase subunit D, partial [Actinomycetia bacterium]|nr:NADH-quinone oxidoreductase subunit D [Actinomycetes bacterium]
MFARIGGVAHDLPAEATSEGVKVVAQLVTLLPKLRVDLNADELHGIAVLTKADAISFGTSGPVAWASGLDNDLRFDGDYLNYQQLRISRPNAYHDGDAYSRFLALLDQLELSVQIIEQIWPHLEATVEADVNVV